jgi:hypothetical protein
MRARRLVGAVAAALAAAGGAACTSFQDVTTVVDLRVLAIATDPSEVILSTAVDLTTSPPTITVDPASIPDILVQPLLPDPIPGRSVTWTLVACPNNPFGAAPPAGGGGAMLGGARSTVGSATCPDNPALTWPLVPDPAPAGEARAVRLAPDQLATAFTRDVYPDQTGHLHGGYDLGEPLVLQLTATDGVTTVVAVKRVLFWANRVSADQVANDTPRISDVVTYAERDPTTFDPVGDKIPLGPGPMEVAQGAHLWIEPQVPAGTAEPYVTTVIDGTTNLAVPDHVERERLRFAFYATAGSFGPARTASELPLGFMQTGDHVHVESQYNAPASFDGLPVDDMGRADVTVWITIRDERGGESWVQRQLLITPPR